VVVASGRTDGPAAGTVSIVVPPGWQASPAERVYRLAPGAHLEFEPTVTPAPGAKPGRYFVAARITDDAGQEHEDVVTIDLAPVAKGHGGAPSPADGSAALAASIERALRTAGIRSDSEATAAVGLGVAADDTGGELTVEQLTRGVRLAAGETAEIRLTLRNSAAGEIRGEAQILSPHETWPAISPWTQGFAVGPGKDAVVTFAVEAPYDSAGGTYWALVKVMYFGRLLYTDSIPVEILPATTSVPAAAASRKGRS
jgi:hypothetical protein